MSIENPKRAANFLSGKEEEALNMTRETGSQALRVSTITDLQREVCAARQKFPENGSDEKQIAIITEELGELAKEVLQWTEKPPRPQDGFSRAEKAYREAIQVACTAVRFAEEARMLATYHGKRQKNAQYGAVTVGANATILGATITTEK